MLKNVSKVSSVEWASSHFSWLFVDSHNIGVKLEEIPRGGKSDLHFHKKSYQFFFVLEGEAVFNMEDHSFGLKKHEGIEVSLGKKHQISNRGKERLLFLLVSSPKVRNDDIFN